MFPGDGFFHVVPVIFICAFVIILGIILFSIVKGVKQWSRNNHQPVLTVPAEIVSKRTQISRHHHNSGDNSMHDTTPTTYFVTFEVESGDRMELAVHGQDYGLLAENDKGRLTLQGTRFKGFERVK